MQGAYGVAEVAVSPSSRTGEPLHLITIGFDVSVGAVCEQVPQTALEGPSPRISELMATFRHSSITRPLIEHLSHAVKLWHRTQGRRESVAPYPRHPHAEP